MKNDTFKDIRRYQKMTMIEYAKWLGVSLATVSMIESGHRNVSDNIRGRMAHRFEVTDDFIEFQQRNKLLIS